jgi:hypothetical protein
MVDYISAFPPLGRKHGSGEPRIELAAVKFGMYVDANPDKTLADCANDVMDVLERETQAGTLREDEGDALAWMRERKQAGDLTEALRKRAQGYYKPRR